MFLGMNTFYPSHLAQKLCLFLAPVEKFLKLSQTFDNLPKDHWNHMEIKNYAKTFEKKHGFRKVFFHFCHLTFLRRHSWQKLTCFRTIDCQWNFCSTFVVQDSLDETPDINGASVHDWNLTLGDPSDILEFNSTYYLNFEGATTLTIGKYNNHSRFETIFPHSFR